MTGAEQARHDPQERDKWLRDAAASLVDNNTRWPGLWTRLTELLDDHAAAEAELREARERLEHSAMEWHITQHEGDIASCPDRACVANLAVLARAGEQA